MPREITVAAVAFFDAEGRVLTVRKRGTERFMFPGGKPEAGESLADAAVREVAEELGLALDPGRLEHVGEFTAPAANEAGHTVKATVFRHPPIGDARPAAEIAETAWVDPADPHVELAPLLLAHLKRVCP